MTSPTLRGYFVRVYMTQPDGARSEQVDFSGRVLATSEPVAAEQAARLIDEMRCGKLSKSFANLRVEVTPEIWPEKSWTSYLVKCGILSAYKCDEASAQKVGDK